MNVNDLWVGDKIRVKSTGTIGAYIGLNPDGKVRLKVSDAKIVITTANNIEVLPEVDYFPDIMDMLQEEKSPPPSKPVNINVNNRIDLHIDKLAPHMENQLPRYILEFQKQKCLEFIQYAITKNYPVIHIIHGKGQGVLKSEIEHMLKQYNHVVKWTFSKNDGGAVEVWLG